MRKPTKGKTMWWIEEGDSAQVLKVLPTASIDALVTDPPAGISFMGAYWDGSKGGRDNWIAWLAGILTECRRVMKPGAYGWVWALPKTSHWTATSCEDAGFSVRDVLVHVFGTGFPKSRASLKPAAEHWILIKAPGELQELRIEESRIGTASTKRVNRAETGYESTRIGRDANLKTECYETGGMGRWPANFALSHSDDCTDTCVEDCPVRLLDEQSLANGMHSAGVARVYETDRETEGATAILSGTSVRKQGRKGDSGGVSRFFYVAKASTKERSAGLPDRNSHPTVKSVALMRHLIRLIAAPGSLILDPFTGSGSTAVAALQEGCRFAGIERDPQYAETAQLRAQHALATHS